jgi:phage tail sheath protein FI
VQFEVKDSIDEPNKNQKIDESLRSHTRYFPSMQESYQNAWVGDNAGIADSSGIVLDSDRFNNGLFTLENIQVVTNSSDLPDPLRWGAASYRRDGVKSGSLQDADGTVYSNTRVLDPSKDFKHLPTRKYLKFSLFMQGGFDGLNMFDKEKFTLSDTAARREMTDSSAQGGKEGPTVATYRKAIDVMEEKSDVDIQLLAIPDQRHEAITDYAIDSVESRFDALFIMDVEEKDNVDAYITGSTQIPNVSNTVTRFNARNLDSSFAAAYYPDVVMVDPVTNTNIVCPPSVAVLGAFSRNDAVAHPWYAPAGFSRGSLNVIESQVKLNRSNLDTLYEADINPITSFPQSAGVIVFGQKTLLAAQSSLDRVNVRRLLIDIRRKVRKVANTILFEPNRAATLARFSAAVSPILTRIQQQQGLDRFKVQIDTSTTTQSDVENNTVRGKIFLQPTRAVEFIALDFVVTNQGANI